MYEWKLKWHCTLHISLSLNLVRYFITISQTSHILLQQLLEAVVWMYHSCNVWESLCASQCAHKNRYMLRLKMTSVASTVPILPLVEDRCPCQGHFLLIFPVLFFFLVSVFQIQNHVQLIMCTNAISYFLLFLLFFVSKWFISIENCFSEVGPRMHTGQSMMVLLWELLQWGGKTHRETH